MKVTGPFKRTAALYPELRARALAAERDAEEEKPFAAWRSAPIRVIDLRFDPALPGADATELSSWRPIRREDYDGEAGYFFARFEFVPPPPRSILDFCITYRRPSKWSFSN